MPKINSYFVVILTFLRKDNNFVIFRSYLPEAVKTIKAYIIIIIIIIITITITIEFISSFSAWDYLPLNTGF